MIKHLFLLFCFGYSQKNSTFAPKSALRHCKDNKNDKINGFNFERIPKEGWDSEYKSILINIKKEDMFFMPYKTKSNVTTEFMNMRKALIVGLTESSKFGFDVLLFNKLNRILYSSCKKDNTTRGSGMLRKKQTYLNHHQNYKKN